MSTSTSYVHTHIYIADMRTKKVSKCAITSEQSVLIVKIVNRNVMRMPHCVNSVGIYLYFVAQE